MGIKGILIISAIMFSLGVFGVLTRKSALGILIAIELMFNSANLNFAAFGRMLGKIEGSIFPLFGIAITVCEVAVGFAIIFYLYRIRKTTKADEVDILKG
uniref:NADH-quinone oxidoreductase subunit K n=1 Tax=candidate division WOR-3 bacterium TaxID=2052148 RepID=A0A7V3ZT22_UNCW3